MKFSVAKGMMCCKRCHNALSTAALAEVYASIYITYFHCIRHNMGIC